MTTMTDLELFVCVRAPRRDVATALGRDHNCGQVRRAPPESLGRFPLPLIA
jgi:hypothetical protein